ncbi:MAG: hypothetical protein J0I64_18045, partial [Devosia sp.]|nr:hypothetical protein [Devosia sp.]
VADEDGMISGEALAKVRIQALARLVLKWEVTDDDGPVAFNTKNLVLFLRTKWIEQQVADFAGDRRNFGPVS